MTLFAIIMLSALAAIGIALIALEILRWLRAKKATFVCVCFDERLIDGGMPDMLIICRTDAEQEEVIRRVCREETRNVYIRRF